MATHLHHHYGNAKIYKLKFEGFFYYGSTIQSPSERLYAHRAAAARHPDRKLYKTIGDNWDKVTIEIVERIGCSTRAELQLKEDAYIKQYLQDTNCLNQFRSYQTEDEKKEQKRLNQQRRKTELSKEELERRRVRANELRRIRRQNKK